MGAFLPVKRAALTDTPSVWGAVTSETLRVMTDAQTMRRIVVGPAAVAEAGLNYLSLGIPEHRSFNASQASTSTWSFPETVSETSSTTDATPLPGRLMGAGVAGSGEFWLGAYGEVSSWEVNGSAVRTTPWASMSKRFENEGDALPTTDAHGHQAIPLIFSP